MKLKLSKEIVELIEETLSKGNIAEVKIEHGLPQVISIKRKKVSKDKDPSSV